IDVKPVAGFAADELDELVRITEIADVRGARGQVPAQCDEMPEAVLAILREHVAETVQPRPDARWLGPHLQSLPSKISHSPQRRERGRQRACARRGGEGERRRAERRLPRPELAARRAELLRTVLGARRKELEAVERLRHGLRPSRSDDSAHEMML